MLRQLCRDASNSGLIEDNRVAPGWGCNPFSSDSSMRIVSLASSQSCHSAISKRHRNIGIDVGPLKRRSYIF